MVDFQALSIKHPVRGLFGIVLSVYSSGLDENMPLVDLAWLNSALLRSSSLKKKDESLKLLRKKIESFKVDDQSNLIVEQGLGLIIGLRVLLDVKLIKPEGIAKFKTYFEKLSHASWFRVREVAALFCYAFKSTVGLEDLVAKAKDYLNGEFKKNRNLVGVTLFGLSQNDNIDDFVDSAVEADIRKLLSSKKGSLEELSYLCLALKDSQSSFLKQEALDRLQDVIYHQLYDVTSENSEVISLLLAILYLSGSETNGKRILEKLERSDIKEEAKKRVYDILKSNDTLRVSFRDSNPIDPLIFKTISIGLFALSQTPLSQAFLFKPELQEKVETFLQATHDKRFKILSKGNLILLLAVFDTVVIFSGISFWWPLFDSLFKSMEQIHPGVVKHVVQWFSWCVFLMPFYIALNFNLGILSRGWFKVGDLFVFEWKTLLRLLKDSRKK